MWVGAFLNKASMYPPIFVGASSFPKFGERDETFLNFPTLAILRGLVGLQDVDNFLGNTSNTANYNHENIFQQHSQEIIDPVVRGCSFLDLYERYNDTYIVRVVVEQIQ